MRLLKAATPPKRANQPPPTQGMGGVARLSYSRRPMPVQPCPACNRPTPRLLDFTSQLASVNYYQCDWCTHIWTAS